MISDAMKERKWKELKCLNCWDIFLSPYGHAKYCPKYTCKPSYQASKMKFILDKYQLTVDQYNELMKISDGKCSICGDKQPLVIDHNHVTQIIRGMVCGRCNTCLSGYIWDHPIRARKAWKHVLGGFRRINKSSSKEQLGLPL